MATTDYRFIVSAIIGAVAEVPKAISANLEPVQLYWDHGGPGSAPRPSSTSDKQDDSNFPVESMFWALTLVTNVVTTGLIGYKAWLVLPIPVLVKTAETSNARLHIESIKSYVKNSGWFGTARAVAVLALLIESGIAYSAIWVRINL